MPYLRRLTLLGLGVFAVLSFLHPLETDDLWWHLKTGQWIAAHGQVPHEDPFASTGPGRPWLCYHWLGSVLLYAVYALGGFAGLKLFCVLFFVLVTASFFMFGRQRVPFPILVLLTGLLVCGLASRALLRPDMFTFLFVPLFLKALMRFEDGGDAKAILWLPVAGALWMNFHLGAVTLGLPLLGIFILALFLKYWQSGGAGDRAAAAGRLKALLGITAAYVIFLCATPNGLDGLIFPIKAALMPSYNGFFKLTDAVAEAQPPGYIFTSFKYLHYHVLFIFSVLVLAFNRRGNFSLTMVFIAALFSFLCFSRNSALYTVAACYVIAEGSRRLGLPGLWERWVGARLLGPGLLACCLLFFAGESLGAANTYVYHKGRSQRSIFLAQNPYSASALEGLALNGFAGPVFNSPVLGGEILWYLYPQVRPFLDGRIMDLARFDEFSAAVTAPDRSWDALEGKYGFKAVLLRWNIETPLVLYLSGRPDWQLIAVNGNIVTFVKRGAYALSEPMNDFEVRLKRTQATMDDFKRLERLNSRPGPGLMGGMASHYSDMDLVDNGITLAALGYQGAAIQSMIEGLRHCRYPYNPKRVAQAMAFMLGTHR